jgi:cytidyltransferase-like protein
MKFGKDLRSKIIQEWRYYSVDYKSLKQSLKVDGDDVAHDHDANFFRILEESERKISKFYADKESWAFKYMGTLEERVEALRDVATPQTSVGESLTESMSASVASISSNEDEPNESEPMLDNEVDAGATIGGTDNLDKMFAKLLNTKRTSFGSAQSFLKEECRRMGGSKEFKAFIYAKKSLTTFDRELSLLIDFLELNKTAFSKILKKFDKRTGSSIREEKMGEISEKLPFLDGHAIRKLQFQVTSLIDEVHALKPQLPEGWENRKVYTIGCFDLFHRGHENVLNSLREFGYFIVAGIHDDESYFQLKGKYTIDNLETRMANVKPFVDQLFVIPSTEPTLFLKSMVSQQDIDMGLCCYARGDDMLEFPGREWAESVMPVHFVPRTEACSSTLIRIIYHAEDEEFRAKAAFAKTRYDGKPVDENGNVL